MTTQAKTFEAFRRLIPGSIRARLSVLFSLVFGAALVATSLVCLKVFTRAHLEDFDAFLFNHAVDVSSTIDPTLRVISFKSDAPVEIEKHRLFSLKRTYLQLSDNDGKILARSQTLKGDKTLPLKRADFAMTLVTKVNYQTLPKIDFSQGEDAGKPYRLISYLVEKPSHAPMLLQIAAPLTLLEQENDRFVWLLFIIIPCSVLVSGVLGYSASRWAFSPVSQMTKDTARIEMKNLKERIDVKESDLELRELGRTLNQLLDRVENAIAAQERFVADASHQLKTPLAIVRGELELLQARPGHSDEVTEALKNASQEVSKLIGLVENLLLLARMDAGLDRVAFQSVRLDELLSEAMGRLQYVARRKNVKLVWGLEPYSGQPERNIDFECPGDSDLIRCLMENLIENAVKYSHDRGTVNVRLAEDEQGYSMSVTDDGVGMSETEVGAIFRRFWRDPQKSMTSSGVGLGLAIAKKIVDLHRGTISVSSQPNRGSSFVVRLSKS